MVARKFSSTVNGGRFHTFTRALVWLKADAIQGFDRSIWRRDIFGNAIRWSDYGNTNSIYGWEIDHIFPVKRGGNDLLSNLQALQWLSNRRKSDMVFTFRG